MEYHKYKFIIIILIQRLLCRKTGYETSPKRKEDGSKTEFQTSIPGFRILRWLSHQRWLSHHWFANVGNDECSQIVVVFFEYHSSFEKVQKCGFSSVYEQGKEESNQAIAQCSSSRVITYEGRDGVHHGFDNSTSSCDDYSDFEPKESGLFSYNGNDQLDRKSVV